VRDALQAHSRIAPNGPRLLTLPRLFRSRSHDHGCRLGPPVDLDCAQRHLGPCDVHCRLCRRRGRRHLSAWSVTPTTAHLIVSLLTDSSFGRSLAQRVSVRSARSAGLDGSDSSPVRVTESTSAFAAPSHQIDPLALPQSSPPSSPSPSRSASPTGPRPLPRPDPGTRRSSSSATRPSSRPSRPSASSSFATLARPLCKCRLFVESPLSQ
jgi:hypothetical protein